jgi:hypothetical protein
MKRAILTGLAALMLCSGCLTNEDLDCWYDDWCKDFADAHAARPPANR